MTANSTADATTANAAANAANETTTNSTSDLATAFGDYQRNDYEFQLPPSSRSLMKSLQKYMRIWLME